MVVFYQFVVEVDFGAMVQLTSPRSCSNTRTRALKHLERHLATACFVTANECEAKDAFLALQHTFECNSRHIGALYLLWS